MPANVIFGINTRAVQFARSRRTLYWPAGQYTRTE
jgi:hypothetical protein